MPPKGRRQIALYCEDVEPILLCHLKIFSRAVGVGGPREVSELVVTQIRLLRETRASIVGDDEDAWALMPVPARDRALANELRTERKLHAALYPPGPNSAVAVGHYAVRGATDSAASVLHGTTVALHAKQR